MARTARDHVRGRRNERGETEERQRGGMEQKEKRRGSEQIRGQLVDHVGAAPMAPGAATCQITHLARVNNYTETHVIVLHYPYISHVACPQGVHFASSYEYSTLGSRVCPARETFPQGLVPGPKPPFHEYSI